jgi:hypothetical protein
MNENSNDVRDVLGFLRDLGVQNPRVGESGEIPVTPGEFQLRKIEVENSTTGLRNVVNSIPRHKSDRYLYSGYTRPICNILGCNLLEFLPIECKQENVEWTEPKINANPFPVEIPQATAFVNPFNARIEGRVTAALNNESEPGKKKITTQYKCRDETEERMETVEESAVLDVQTEFEFSDIGQGEIIDTITPDFLGINPDVDEESTESFRKEGNIPLIKSIVDVWVSGNMNARYNGSMDVEYRYKGRTRKETFNVDVEARVPVNNLNYNW